MRLKGKVAMITGVGGGIGRATARRFAKEGARLIIHDIDSTNLERVAEMIREDGGEVLAEVMDHTDKDQVTGAVDRGLKAYGRIDVLCNIAGLNRDALCKKMSEEVFDQVIRINLKGPWLCCQAVIPVMSEQKSGSIINTSSIGAHGNPGQTNYAAAKAGVIALSKSLALEMARFNVTVNTVAPGATDTPLLRNTPQEFLEKFKAGIPLKRFASPEELAGAYLFFADDDARYITGQVLFVAGGLDMVFK